MEGFIEKLISRLEEETYNMEICEEQFDMNSPYFMDVEYKMVKFDDAKTIINELAEEYFADTPQKSAGGWIPCSERMPEEHDSLFAKYKGTSEWSIGMYEKYSDDVNVTVEYKDGTRRTKTLHTIDGVWWEDGIVPYKVIAWQPLPEPYKS